MKKLLLSIIMVLLASCAGSDRKSGMWQWSKTTVIADSLSRDIDRMHFSGSPRDSIIRSAGLLLEEARRQENDDLRNLLVSRYHYMMSRQARYDDNAAEAKLHLHAGMAMIDSTRHPYEFHRYRALHNSMRPENSKEVMIQTLRDFMFYRTLGDRAMEATTAILLGHKLSDANAAEKALRYYTYADSIFNELGMHVASSKNNINIANELMNSGDSLGCDSLLRVMRADPAIRRDRKARNLVLRNSYLYSGDITYLREAYNMAMETSKSSAMKTFYEMMFNRHYAEKEVIPDSADHYSRLAFAGIDSISSHYQKYLLYLGESERMKRRGDADSAYSLLRLSMAEADTFRQQNEPEEVIRVQNVLELSRMEEDMTHAGYTYRLRILYICIAALVISAFLATLLFVRERLHKATVRRSMLQQMESEKERERARRQLIVMSLVKEESDKALGAIKEEINGLRQLGKVSNEEASCIDAVIRNHAIQSREWETFQEQFEKTNPNFIKRLREISPGITENQIRLAIYIHIGMTNKQISSFMNIRQESIKQSRWRLRSRLGLKQEDSLEEFLASIGD